MFHVIATMATTAAAAASATATTGDKQQGLCGSFAMGAFRDFWSLLGQS